MNWKCFVIIFLKKKGRRRKGLCVDRRESVGSIVMLLNLYIRSVGNIVTLSKQTIQRHLLVQIYLHHTPAVMVTAPCIVEHQHFQLLSSHNSRAVNLMVTCYVLNNVCPTLPPTPRLPLPSHHFIVSFFSGLNMLCFALTSLCCINCVVSLLLHCLEWKWKIMDQKSHIITNQNRNIFLKECCIKLDAFPVLTTSEMVRICCLLLEWWVSVNRTCSKT